MGQNPMTTALAIAALLMAVSASVGSATFTDEQKKTLVVVHNRLRQTAVPFAASMNFVVWSSRLEGLAVKAAKACKEEHNYGPEYAGLGENIYGGHRTDPFAFTMCWFTEKTGLNHETKACSYSMCGHYTQIMTSAVTEIGCGIHKCGTGGSSNLIFCEYNAGGSVFAFGPQCSACPKERPFCLNGLCISKDLAADPIVKEVDATASVSSLKCQLICKNCGKRDTQSGNCKCICRAGTSGDFCETLAAGTTPPTCSPCTETPPCLNGGVEDASDKTKCQCTCASGFVGKRCEIAKEANDNSLKLTLAAAGEFKFVTFVVMPPVSRAFFNTKLWTNLQAELASAVNSFCRASAGNFGQCCPGKTFPGADKVASAEHISASNLKFTESSVHNTLDGSLHLLVHAEVPSSSALCNAGARRRKRSVGKYLAQSVLHSAIEMNAAAVSAKLKSCCDDVILKEYQRPGSAGTGGRNHTAWRGSGDRPRPRMTPSLLAVYLIVRCLVS